MAEINVTPFVDVMLVLLIIFMVTAPLLNSGVPIELPDSRAAALPQEQDPVTVTVSPDGAIYVGDDAVAPGALAQTLAAIPRGPDGAPPQINLRGDRSIDYGRMMGVMGELNRAGFTSIALLTGAATAEPVVEQGVVAAPTPEPAAPTSTPEPAPRRRQRSVPVQTASNSAAPMEQAMSSQGTGRGISRGEWIGLGAALALHVALLGVLLTEPEIPAVQKEALPEAITVSLADDVGLQASAPERVLESRASMGPVLSDIPAPSVGETAPASRPVPIERPTIRPPERADNSAARTPAARAPAARAPAARRSTPSAAKRATPRATPTPAASANASTASSTRSGGASRKFSTGVRRRRHQHDQHRQQSAGLRHQRGCESEFASEYHPSDQAALETAGRRRRRPALYQCQFQPDREWQPVGQSAL